MSVVLSASPPLLPIFNALPGANLLLAPDLRIVGASDDYLAATITQRATIVGQFIFDAFPDNPETPEANGVANVRASLEQVLATKQPHTMAPQHYDVPNPAQPGQFVERHWLPLHTPVLDATGQVQFIIQSVQDVTANRLAERQLRESRTAEWAARAEADAQRQRLHDFMSAAPGIVLSLVGPQHIIEFANEGFRQQFGVADPVGKPYREAIPTAADQYAQEYQATDLYDHVYRTGESYYAAEAPYYIDPTHSGQRELRYFTFSMQAARDGTGRTVGVQAYASDVTEQVLARQQIEYLNQELEARVRERTATLQESEARFRHLVEQAPVAITLTRGPDVVIESINTAMLRIMGKSAPEEVLGKAMVKALPQLESEAIL
jgi:PAS domain-containing protein